MVALVLLGAGASYGSGDVSPEPPPIGARLFERLQATSETARQIPDRIKALFSEEDFEAGMAAYYEHTKGNIGAFQRDLAHCLATCVAGPNNAYRRLVTGVRHARVVYSTLNYDTLFEQSTAQLGHDTAYSATRDAGKIRLLKIHGSCNVWPRARMSGSLNIIGGRIDFEGPGERITRDETLRRCVEDALSPAIAVFTKGKAVKVCPGFVRDQQAQWTMTVKSASRIFISGVLVRPEDDHIWQPLQTSHAKIHYYGFSDADREAFETWQASRINGESTFIRAPFGDAADDIARQLKS